MARRTIAIVNPNNGPRVDSGSTSDYNICVNFLRSKGVRVIGYVHTKVGYPNINGYRPIEEVNSDCAYWKSTYSVDGIFVDEVTNLWP